MEQYKNDNRQTEDILESTTGMSRAEMPPFFYTRLMARMEPGQEIPGHRWFSRPALSVVTLAILLALNISVVIHYVQAVKHTENTTGGLQELVSEMNRDYSSIDDKKTNE